MELVDRPEPDPPRPRPRLRGPDRRRRRAGARAPRRSSRSTPNPRQPRQAVRPRGDRGPRRLDPHAGRSSSRSSSGRALEGGFELIAGERRWRAAREAGSRRCRRSCARRTTATRCCSGWSRTSRARICRRRGGARLRAAARRVRASLGDVAERVGKSKPTISNRCGCSSSGRRARDGRAGRAVRGPRARGARGSGPRRPPPPRAPDHRRGPVGPGGRAGRSLVGRADEGAHEDAPSTPRWPRAIKERPSVLTGFEARVGRAGVHDGDRHRGAARGARRKRSTGSPSRRRDAIRDGRGAPAR